MLLIYYVELMIYSDIWGHAYITKHIHKDGTKGKDFKNSKFNIFVTIKRLNIFKYSNIYIYVLYLLIIYKDIKRNFF